MRMLLWKQLEHFYKPHKSPPIAPSPDLPVSSAGLFEPMKEKPGLFIL
jgi:hypothetical protein